MIPKSVIQKVIDATDIVEIVGEYVPLKKKGTSYFGLCPFHDDKNPSMSVSGEKKIFNCFSCGTKGNVIYFVAKHDNLTMEQATIKLAKRAGIPINEYMVSVDNNKTRLLSVMNEAYSFYRFYLYSSEEGQLALEYLKSRGFTDEEITEYKIGLAPKAIDYLHQALDKKEISTIDQIELGLVKENNGKFYDVFRGRIMFSITNPSGQIVGFSGRIYEKSDQAKYINSIENDLFHKSEILYHFNQASLTARKLDQMYVFEGFMDVIATRRAGLLNGVATMGTAMTKEHIRLITSITKNIVLFFDGDEAGIKALKRSTSMLSEKHIIPNAVILPNDLDPDEYITKYGKEKFVSFINNNMKSAYLVLYDYAYKKVYFNDLASVETFKQEMFRMITASKSEVITNYFINQLTSDLKLDRETLIKELSANSYQTNYVTNNYYDNNESNLEIKIEQNRVNPVNKKKTIKITPRVIKSYNTIIKASIYSKEQFSVFFEHFAKDNIILYPGSELSGQYDLLYTLCMFYSSNPDLEGMGTDLFIEQLKTKPLLLNLAKEIINDKFIDENNQQLFDDSIETIRDYFNKVEIAATYNATIMSSNDEERNKNISEFIKINKNQKRIINEEDM